MNKCDVLLLENQLCFPLYVCAKEIVNAYTPYLSKIDLTYTQYITMMVMWEEKEVLTRRLKERLYLDSGTLTPVLNRLEEKGFISKERSKEDARDLLVTITEKGEKLKNKALLIPEQVSYCVEGLENTEELKECLDQLMKILRKNKEK